MLRLKMALEAESRDGMNNSGMLRLHPTESVGLNIRIDNGAASAHYLPCHSTPDLYLNIRIDK